MIRWWQYRKNPDHLPCRYRRRASRRAYNSREPAFGDGLNVVRSGTSDLAHGVCAVEGGGKRRGNERREDDCRMDEVRAEHCFRG